MDKPDAQVTISVAGQAPTTHQYANESEHICSTKLTVTEIPEERIGGIACTYAEGPLNVIVGGHATERRGVTVRVYVVAPTRQIAVEDASAGDITGEPTSVVAAVIKTVPDITDSRSEVQYATVTIYDVGHKQEPPLDVR